MMDSMPRKCCSLYATSPLAEQHSILQQLSLADFEEFQKLQDAAQGLIKIVTLAQALKLCTVNPARLLAKAGVKLAGKLAVGAPADIVLFYFDGGQRLSVRSTLLYGELMA